MEINKLIGAFLIFSVCSIFSIFICGFDISFGKKIYKVILMEMFIFIFTIGFYFFS